ncbi:hypothetical protein NDU88_007130 [Pleurodeles waltl]|uniref:Uncharacterized protein n=1 Tax=Pleurodeles waltl TaxID=8319 RepID=A0AAV7NS81_PLEWA|nr:hypothetical protein NDU88_007130 [Pleurodeles waltl]
MWALRSARCFQKRSATYYAKNVLSRSTSGALISSSAAGRLKLSKTIYREAAHAARQKCACARADGASQLRAPPLLPRLYNACSLNGVMLLPLVRYY